MPDDHESSSEGSGASNRVHSSALSSPISGITTPEKVSEHLDASMAAGLGDLFSENVAAKIWRVAVAYIEHDVRSSPMLSAAKILIDILLVAEP